MSDFLDFASAFGKALPAIATTIVAERDKQRNIDVASAALTLQSIDTRIKTNRERADLILKDVNASPQAKAQAQALYDQANTLEGMRGSAASDPSKFNQDANSALTAPLTIPNQSAEAGLQATLSGLPQAIPTQTVTQGDIQQSVTAATQAVGALPGNLAAATAITNNPTGFSEEAVTEAKSYVATNGAKGDPNKFVGAASTTFTTAYVQTEFAKNPEGALAAANWRLSKGLDTGLTPDSLTSLKETVGQIVQLRTLGIQDAQNRVQSGLWDIKAKDWDLTKSKAEWQATTDDKKKALWDRYVADGNVAVLSDPNVRAEALKFYDPTTIDKMIVDAQTNHDNFQAQLKAKTATAQIGVDITLAQLTSLNINNESAQQALDVTKELQGLKTAGEKTAVLEKIASSGAGSIGTLRGLAETGAIPKDQLQAWIDKANAYQKAFQQKLDAASTDQEKNQLLVTNLKITNEDAQVSLDIKKQLAPLQLADAQFKLDMQTALKPFTIAGVQVSTLGEAVKQGNAAKGVLKGLLASGAINQEQYDGFVKAADQAQLAIDQAAKVTAITVDNLQSDTAWAKGTRGYTFLGDLADRKGGAGLDMLLGIQAALNAKDPKIMEQFPGMTGDSLNGLIEHARALKTQEGQQVSEGDLRLSSLAQGLKINDIAIQAGVLGLQMTDTQIAQAKQNLKVSKDPRPMIDGWVKAGAVELLKSLTPDDLSIVPGIDMPALIKEAEKNRANQATETSNRLNAQSLSIAGQQLTNDGQQISNEGARAAIDQLKTKQIGDQRTQVMQWADGGQVEVLKAMSPEEFKALGFDQKTLVDRAQNNRTLLDAGRDNVLKAQDLANQTSELNLKTGEFDLAKSQVNFEEAKKKDVMTAKKELQLWIDSGNVEALNSVSEADWKTYGFDKAASLDRAKTNRSIADQSRKLTVQQQQGTVDLMGVNLDQAVQNLADSKVSADRTATEDITKYMTAGNVGILSSPKFVAQMKAMGYTDGDIKFFQDEAAYNKDIKNRGQEADVTTAEGQAQITTLAAERAAELRALDPVKDAVARGEALDKIASQGDIGYQVAQQLFNDGTISEAEKIKIQTKATAVQNSNNIERLSQDSQFKTIADSAKSSYNALVARNSSDIEGDLQKLSAAGDAGVGFINELQKQGIITPAQANAAKIDAKLGQNDINLARLQRNQKIAQDTITLWTAPGMQQTIDSLKKSGQWQMLKTAFGMDDAKLEGYIKSERARRANDVNDVQKQKDKVEAQGLFNTWVGAKQDLSKVDPQKLAWVAKTLGISTDTITKAINEKTQADNRSATMDDLKIASAKISNATSNDARTQGARLFTATLTSIKTKTALAVKEYNDGKLALKPGSADYFKQLNTTIIRAQAIAKEDRINATEYRRTATSILNNVTASQADKDMAYAWIKEADRLDAEVATLSGDIQGMLKLLQPTAPTAPTGTAKPQTTTTTTKPQTPVGIPAQYQTQPNGQPLRALPTGVQPAAYIPLTQTGGYLTLSVIEWTSLTGKTQAFGTSTTGKTPDQQKQMADTYIASLIKDYGLPNTPEVKEGLRVWLANYLNGKIK
jgi:hypothetical protein